MSKILSIFILIFCDNLGLIDRVESLTFQSDKQCSRCPSCAPCKGCSVPSSESCDHCRLEEGVTKPLIISENTILSHENARNPRTLPFPPLLPVPDHLYPPGCPTYLCINDRCIRDVGTLPLPAPTCPPCPECPKCRKHGLKCPPCKKRKRCRYRESSRC